MKRKLQTRHLATRVAYKLALAAVSELKLSARYAYRPYRTVAVGWNTPYLHPPPPLASFPRWRQPLAHLAFISNFTFRVASCIIDTGPGRHSRRHRRAGTFSMGQLKRQFMTVATTSTTTTTTSRLTTVTTAAWRQSYKKSEGDSKILATNSQKLFETDAKLGAR